MPLVRITVDASTPEEQGRAIGNAVHEAMVAALGIPKSDRFQIIEALPASSLIFDEGYLGVARERVVFVQITLVRGRTVEQKKELYRRIAEYVSATGVRAEDVFVQLTETGREDWSLGNGEAQALDTELLARYGWTPPGS